MKRQLRIRPAGELPQDQDAERLLSRQPRATRSRILRTRRLEVLLNEPRQRTLLIQQRTHRRQFLGVRVVNPRSGEGQLRRRVTQYNCCAVQ